MNCIRCNRESESKYCVTCWDFIIDNEYIYIKEQELDRLYGKAICKYCGSENLKSDGTTRGKKRYRCGKCGKTNYSIGSAYYMRTPIKIVEITKYLNSWCGYSTRQISEYLLQRFSVYYHHSSVNRWINMKLDKKRRKSYEVYNI